MTNELDIIIGMGSNSEADKHLQMAHKLLCARYPSIVFSSIQTTQPIGMKHNTSCFLNQLARLHTTDTAEQVRATLKEIERLSGRQAIDKAHEIIKLDLDILQINMCIIKADELNRPYYQQALREL